MQAQSLAEYIQYKYECRKEKNPRYSFRAFCRDLDITAGRMLNISKGRDNASPQFIEKLITNLKLNKEETRNFREIIEKEQYLKRGNGFQKVLGPEEFRLVSDWKTLSILTYIQTGNLTATADAISKELKLSSTEVKKGLSKLIEVGLIEKKDELYEVLHKNITTTTDIPSKDIREYHKGFIKLAYKSIDSVPVELRDVTGMIMSIDASKLPELKKVIADFRANLCQLAESGNVNKVYQLNVQFFPAQGDYEE